MFYYLLSIQRHMLPEITRGGAQPFLSLKMINKIKIKTASIQEQIEIVRILDNLFVKEQKIKELCEEIIDKIDLMKKSILARAFRGELGTNDPTEESSIELLKKCL